jgi:hypothetical protein
LWHVNAPYHTCTHTRLHEDESSAMKHVEDIVKIKNYFNNKCDFCWFILYDLQNL